MNESSKNESPNHESPKLNWLESRSGLVSIATQFFDEAIPKSVGWRNTLGAAVGALLILQIISGALLMLYYVPHPEAALQSIQYIEKSITAGALTRALHYWGATFIIVALALHIARVFYAGAYRKPRELMWLVGLALLGIVMALAFTGQLLPWDQKGYWAAKVGVEIASSAPLAGPMIKTLIQGGETIGALTLTRFYALHVVLLPLLLALVAIVHIIILRKNGPHRPPSDTTTDTVPFFPAQVLRDLVVVCAATTALFTVSLLWGGPNSQPVDPTDTTYLPRPEWYFMSHFELLRFTPGSLKVVATFIIPSILAFLMIALPWLDCGKTSALRDRRLTIAAGSFVFATIIGLTAQGMLNEPKERATETAALETDTENSAQQDPAALGRRLTRKHKCVECHKIAGRGGTIGPDISNAGYKFTPDFLRAWIADPATIKPDTQMPPTQLNADDMDALIAYLMTLQEQP